MSGGTLALLGFAAAFGLMALRVLGLVRRRRD